MDIIEKPSDIKITKINMSCDKSPKGFSKVLDWNGAYLIAGPPKSGKTNLLVNLISKRSKKTFYRKFDRIHIFSPSLKTIGKKIDIPDEDKYNKFDSEIVQGILDDIPDDENHLFIFDDCIVDLGKKSNRPIVLNMIYNRRHYGGGITIIITSQKYRKCHHDIRVATSNLMMFSKSRIELDAIHSEFSNLPKDAFYNLVLKKVFKDKYDFLYMRTQEPEGSKYHRSFNPLRIKFHDD